MEVRTPAMKTALLTVKPQDDFPGLSTSCYVNWKCLRQQIHYQKICHENSMKISWLITLNVKF